MILPVETPHTYIFTFEGQTFQRTTSRVYAYALVLWMDCRYVPGGPPGAIEPCAPYIVDVVYSATRAGALRAMRPWYCRSDMIALPQPGACGRPRKDPMSERTVLASHTARQRARAIRNRQWRFMERVALHAPLWFCAWNKERRPTSPDEMRSGLLTGMALLRWQQAHADWFVIGAWDALRDAEPIWLTPLGHQALQDRARYDMEPVEGGLIEPGWVAIPLPGGEEERLHG